MKAGISFANSGPFSRPELFGQLAREAEEFGFESIWTVEHVIIPQPHMPYPGSKDGSMPGGDDVPIPDPLLDRGDRFVAEIGVGTSDIEHELRRSLAHGGLPWRTVVCQARSAPPSYMILIIPTSLAVHIRGINRIEIAEC